MNIQQLLSSNDEIEQRTLLENMLNSLFAGKTPVEELFSSAYQQCSDGKTLDFAGFNDHLCHLRGHVNTVEFKVVDVCLCEDRLAERHIATVSHKDGQLSKIEVYVFMRLRENKIISLDEVSRVIVGAEQDGELASATS
ncbi:hypothetical protein [Gynuella sp.]|uniref:hypothetical protein n=1 Tax=Gynuella sp. TaxID=2969146 RepID=UPI003D0C4B67